MEESAPDILGKISDTSHSSSNGFQQQQQSVPIADDSSVDTISKGISDDDAADKVTELAFAVADFKPFGVNQLSFSEGQAVTILLKQDSNWWWAEIDGCRGYVPANHFTTQNSQRVLWQDEEYFGNYGHIKLHQEMLSDKPRTDAYLRAIRENKTFLEGKVVLDVGCGTGVLSMFCAKFGNCKKVYAVEASDFADHTRSLVKQNGLSDQITVIQDYVEDVTLPETVDVIVSEWMGTFLLFEMMLECVIAARDKCLRADGVILPASAALYFVPCSAEQHYTDTSQFWGNLYGLDFSLLRDVAVEEYYERPVSDYVLKTEDCLTDAATILRITMATVTVEELEAMVETFEFVIKKPGTMHGFCSWFEVEFPPLTHEAQPVILNTGPWNTLTHWRQNLFMLDEPIKVERGDVISGSVKIQRNPKLRRHIRLHVNFTVTRGEDESSVVKAVEKVFKIWR